MTKISMDIFQKYDIYFYKLMKQIKYEIFDYRYEEIIDGKTVPFEYDGVNYRCVASALYASTFVEEPMKVTLSPLSGIEAKEQIDAYVKKWGTDFVDHQKKREHIQPILWARFGKNEKLCGELLEWIDGGQDIPEDAETSLEDLTKFRSDYRKFEEIEKSNVFSLGYGNMTFATLVDTLKKYKIEFVFDVRGDRHSHNSAFSGDGLKERLDSHGISYVWMKVLVDIPLNNEPVFDIDGHISYPEFWTQKKEEKILEIVEKAKAQNRRIVFLSDKMNPAECHRGKLLGYKLQNCGYDIVHIYDGKLIKQSDLTIEEPQRSFENLWPYSPHAHECLEKISSLCSRCLEGKESLGEILSTKRIREAIKTLGEML